MEKELIISKLSGDGFLIRTGGKDFGFNSWDSLTAYIGDELSAALWPKGPTDGPDSCALIIKTK